MGSDQLQLLQVTSSNTLHSFVFILIQEMLHHEHANVVQEGLLTTNSVKSVHQSRRSDGLLKAWPLIYSGCGVSNTKHHLFSSTVCVHRNMNLPCQNDTLPYWVHLQHVSLSVSPDRKISTNGWIALKFCTGIHDPWRTNHSGFGDPLIYPLAPPVDQVFQLICEISQYRLSDRTKF